MQESCPVIQMQRTRRPFHVHCAILLVLSPLGLLKGVYVATAGGFAGHYVETKVPVALLLASGSSGYTTVAFGGHHAVIPGIHRKPLSRPCPQGARKASHRRCMCRKLQGHVHSVESPGFSAFGGGSRMLFWCAVLGFSDSLLVYTWSCIAEAAICANVSTEPRAPFLGVSVDAVAWLQGSFIIKWLKFSDDPGHRSPTFHTFPHSSNLALQSTRFQSSAMVPVRESWSTVTRFHNSWNRQNQFRDNQN